MTFKIAIAAGLMLVPATLLAQPAEQIGNGMGTEADAAAHSNTTPAPGTHPSTTHHVTKGRPMHSSPGHAGAKGSTNTNGSAPLNPMPH